MKNSETESPFNDEAESPRKSAYTLVFKSHSGDLMSWVIITSGSPEEIQKKIEIVAKEWLSSSEGRKYVADEELVEWGVDYANALLNVPVELFNKHGIFLWSGIKETIVLDPNENLLTDTSE